MKSHNCRSTLCDTPHYEEESDDVFDHQNDCACIECHTYKHEDQSHVGLCGFCNDEEQDLLDQAEAAAFDEEVY